MNKFHHSKIYKMVNLIDDKIYVGATTNRLATRKQGHKDKAKENPSPSHKHWNAIGWENVEIILLENVNCENRFELRKRERHWIDLLQPELNTQLPQPFQNTEMTESEWRKSYRENNAEQFADRMKVYYEANKLTLLADANEYYTNNKEHILKQKKLYHAANKEVQNTKSRAYHAVNKEVQNTRNRAYHLKNRDVLYAKQSALVECDCGSVGTHNKAPRHKLSKNHRQWQAIHDFIYA